MRNAMLAVVAVCGFAGPVVAQTKAEVEAKAAEVAGAETVALLAWVGAADGKADAGKLLDTVRNSMWLGQLAHWKKVMTPADYAACETLQKDALAAYQRGLNWHVAADDCYAEGVTKREAGYDYYTGPLNDKYALAMAAYTGSLAVFELAESHYTAAADEYTTAAGLWLCAAALMNSYPAPPGGGGEGE